MACRLGLACHSVKQHGRTAGLSSEVAPCCETAMCKPISQHPYARDGARQRSHVLLGRCPTARAGARALGPKAAPHPASPAEATPACALVPQPLQAKCARGATQWLLLCRPCSSCLPPGPQVKSIRGVNRMPVPVFTVEAIENCKGLSSFEVGAAPAARSQALCSSACPWLAIELERALQCVVRSSCWRCWAAGWALHDMLGRLGEERAAPAGSRCRRTLASRVLLE